MTALRFVFAAIALAASGVPVAFAVRGMSFADEKEQPSLADLKWLSGYWGSEHDGVEIEEYWMRPKGGLMLGVHREVRAGRAIGFEYLRIEQRPDAISYLASPQGRAATAFELRELSETEAIFENLKHDFPQRIVYELTDEDVLDVRIENESGSNRMQWTWERIYPEDLEEN